MLRIVKGNTFRLTFSLQNLTFQGGYFVGEDYDLSTVRNLKVSIRHEEHVIDMHPVVDHSIIYIESDGDLWLGAYDIEVTFKDSDGDSLRYAGHNIFQIVEFSSEDNIMDGNMTLDPQIFNLGVIGIYVGSGFIQIAGDLARLKTRDKSSLVNAINEVLNMKIEAGSGGGGAVTLDGLYDVDINEPKENEVLAYDPVADLWRNQPVELDITKEWLAENYLSKVNEDTAAELIRYIKGIIFGEDSTNRCHIIVDQETGETSAVFDRLKVNLKAYFEELQIQKTSNIAGRDCVTPAGGVVFDIVNEITSGETVTGYRCYFLAEQEGVSTDNLFLTGDFIINKEAKFKTGVTSHAENKFYWRRITAVSSEPEEIEGKMYHWVILDNNAGGYSTGSDVPAAGDTGVQLGSDHADKRRQNAIIISATDDNSPCITLYQGINTFSLDNRAIVDIGFDPTEDVDPAHPERKRAYIKCYGDFYAGDSGPNPASFIKYDNVNHEVTIKGKIIAGRGSTIENLSLEEILNQAHDSAKDLVDALQDTLQSQIDSAIETWFDNGVPYPCEETLPEGQSYNYTFYNQWNTEAIRNNHVGDLYYDRITNFAYRYIKNSSDEYIWSKVLDNDIAKALADAANAQATADGKMKVFYGPYDPSTIKPPYQIGDIWVNAKYPSERDPSVYNNDLLRCKAKKDTGEPFSISDWVLASKYTDDTVAIDARDKANDALNSIQNLKYIVDNYEEDVLEAFGDGIIDEAETIVLNNYKNTIETLWAEVVATYTVLANNEFLISLDDAAHSFTPYANLVAAFGNLSTSKINLLKAIDDAIEDKVIVEGESTDVNSKFSDFNRDYAAYCTALEQANEAIQKYIYNKLDNKINGYEYLKIALQGTTEIDGGLVLTNLIKLLSAPQYLDDAHTIVNNNAKIMSGLNGVVPDPNNVGRTIAFWAGGDILDLDSPAYYNDPEKPIKPEASEFNDYGAFKDARDDYRDELNNFIKERNIATSIIRMDGTGYLSGGAIGWRADGSAYLADGAVEITKGGIIKANPETFTIVTGDSASQPIRTYLDNYMKAYFSNGIQFKISDSESAYIKWDADNNAFYVERSVNNSVQTASFYATGGVSAFGPTSVPTSGSGGGLDPVALWELLGNNDSTKKIDISHIPDLRVSDITDFPVNISYFNNNANYISTSDSRLSDARKNPYMLKFGTKTYDGSEEKTISAADLGALTGITSAMITRALGYTPYSDANPAGYITSAALSPYLLKSVFEDLFEKVNIGTESHPVYAIKAKYDFFSVGGVTAYGDSSVNTGGQGGLDLVAMWAELGTDTTQKVIDVQHIPDIPTSKIIGYKTPVQPDWGATDTNSLAFIKNKPTSLKNPKALTFGSDSYDGSAAKEITAASIGAYVKPDTGIPKSDLASAVQTSLGKADSALQQHQTIRTLEIQHNGTDVDTFNPTASSNKTININSVASITVPTGFSAGQLQQDGDIEISFESGYSLPTTAKQNNWDSVYTWYSTAVGADTDNVINKWEEIVAFLANYTEADTLADLLGNKADKTITISAGKGLTGGGTLADNRTLSVKNSNASITVTSGGIRVNVIDDYTTTSNNTVRALAAARGKDLNDRLKLIEDMFEWDGTDIKAKANFYSVGGITAFGAGTTGTTGGGGLDLVAMWEALGTDNTQQVIDVEHIPSIPTSKIIGYPTNIVNTFGGQNGTITVRGGQTGNGSVNLAMSGKQLQASIVGLGSLAYSSATIPTNTNQLTNGAGYITGITSSMVTNALGYTPMRVNSDGGVEVGQYMDWHIKGQTYDYNVRLNCPNVVDIAINLPSSAGTLALTSQIPTDTNQLTNGAGYITSSGSCNYASSAGTATTASSAGVLTYSSDIDSQNKLDAFIKANQFKIAKYETFDIGLGSVSLISGMVLSMPFGSSTQYGCQIAVDDGPTGLIAFRQKSTNWGSWYYVATREWVEGKGYITGITSSMVTAALGYTPPTSDTNTWRPLGTGANDACAGNDSRLSNSRPASDVYAWAKAASPSWLPLGGGTLTGILNIATGIGIDDASGNGLLVYHPTSFSGISSSQWGVGATDCQGVIRSDASNLRHYRGGTTYDIIDGYNIGSQSVYYATSSGSCTGNAATASKVLDSTNTHEITITYAKTEQSSTSWLASWNGYELGSISPSAITAGKATTLQTSRTIWGQSFNGSANISGTIAGCDNIHNSGGNLYLGNKSNSGWVLCQDMCSKDSAGDGIWSIRTNGAGVFASLTSRGTITASGNITSSGNVTAYSDIRLKDVVRDSSLSVRDFANAPLFDFRWKGRKDDRTIHLGTSAQYWQKKAKVVHKQKDEIGTLALDYATLGTAGAIVNARRIIELERRLAKLEKLLAERV